MKHSALKDIDKFRQPISELSSVLMQLDTEIALKGKSSTKRVKETLAQSKKILETLSLSINKTKDEVFSRELLGGER